MAYRNIAEASAYRSSPKKKKEEEGSPIEQYKKAFLQSLESYDTKQKKPVRWNFFKDNEGMFQLSRAINPMVKSDEVLYRILTKAMGKEKLHPTEQIAQDFRIKTYGLFVNLEDVFIVLFILFGWHFYSYLLGQKRQCL